MDSTFDALQCQQFRISVRPALREVNEECQILCWMTMTRCHDLNAAGCRHSEIVDLGKLV